MPNKLKNTQQEQLNPCLKEQNMTYKCLNDNNFDREKCLKHMENYKNCKSFWGTIKAQRRQKGITPALPALEDRERVKQEFFENARKH